MDDLVLQQALNRLLANQYNIMAALIKTLGTQESRWLRESMSHTSRIRNAVIANDPAEASRAIGAA